MQQKRSSAERLAPGVDPNRLVVEPYANPFRTYPLVNNYKKFRKLVKERNVDCYIINTGDFMGKDIKPATTISAIEQVVEGTGEFKQWGPFTDIEVLEMEGYVSDFNDMNYVETLKARMTDRTKLCLRKRRRRWWIQCTSYTGKRSFSKSYWRSTQFRSGKFQ